MGYWDEREKKKKQPEPEEDEVTLEELEQNTLAEITEVEQGFRDRMKVENKRFRDMCDTEYCSASASPAANRRKSCCDPWAAHRREVPGWQGFCPGGQAAHQDPRLEICKNRKS